MRRSPFLSPSDPIPLAMASEFSAAGPFPKTRRSVIAALGADDAMERARSFEVLARTYWRPVYAHVRLRFRRPPEEARDLTQEFFARALEKRWLRSYDASQARFRTYLRTCLDRFVIDALRDERREKRGGGALRLALDFDVAEAELPAGATPDACFDEEWTRALFAGAVATLAATCRERGKPHVFALFERYVLDDLGDDAAPRPSYADLAREHGISVTDVTNHLAWARREFRAAALDALREITASDEEFRAEARDLFGVEP